MWDIDKIVEVYPLRKLEKNARSPVDDLIQANNIGKDSKDWASKTIDEETRCDVSDEHQGETLGPEIILQQNLKNL